MKYHAHIKKTIANNHVKITTHKVNMSPSIQHRSFCQSNLQPLQKWGSAEFKLSLEK